MKYVGYDHGSKDGDKTCKVTVQRLEDGTLRVLDVTYGERNDSIKKGTKVPPPFAREEGDEGAGGRGVPRRTKA